MHKADWDDFMTQDASAIGSPLASEIVVNGYKYNTILGWDEWVSELTKKYRLKLFG